MKKNQFPLFPELTEQGAIEAQELINKFKKELVKASKNILDSLIGEFYCDILPYIESDSWTNFRNELMSGFKNYDNKKIQGEYDFKDIRQAIFEEHRSEIIKDLNQDYLEENKRLKDHIAFIEKSR